MDNYIITKEQLKWIVAKHPEEFYLIAKEIVNQSAKNDNTCLLCGAGLKKYWHKMTPILVKCLAEAYRVVSKKNKNYFSRKELNLDHSEYNNFQKLRFHGLIARYKEHGEWRKGDWLITRRGFQLLQGRLKIPARVQTFRNEVVDHDKKVVDLKDIMGSKPYVESEFMFEFDVPDNSLFDQVVIQH